MTNRKSQSQTSATVDTTPAPAPETAPATAPETPATVDTTPETAPAPTVVDATPAAPAVPTNDTPSATAIVVSDAARARAAAGIVAARSETNAREASRIAADERIALVLSDPSEALLFLNDYTPFVAPMRNDPCRDACNIVRQLRAHVTAWAACIAAGDADGAEEHKLDVQAGLFLLSARGPKSVRKSEGSDLNELLRHLQQAAQRASRAKITANFVPLTGDYRAFLARRAERDKRAQLPAPAAPADVHETDARAANAAAELPAPTVVDATPAPTVDAI